MPSECVVQDVLDQGGFPGARDTRNGDEEPERNLDVDVAQIVLASAFDSYRSRRIGGTPPLWNVDRQLAAQVFSRYRRGMRRHLFDCAFGDHKAAMLPGTGPEVDE